MTDDLVSLASDQMSVLVNPFGAELFALRDHQGRDYLWNGDPRFWASRAPLLFPVVGALSGDGYRHRGQRFDLGKHGFARRRRFAVVEQDARRATFRLEADEETLKAYPFVFALSLKIALDGARLSLQAIIENRGETDMPASFGFHPALNWPPPGGRRDRTQIVFHEAEPEGVRRIDAHGLLRQERLKTPVVGRTLKLEDALFEDDALIFDRLSSASLRLESEGGVAVEVSFSNAPLLGLWTKPGAGYVCVEPWRGHADPVGFDGELTDKPGVFVLAPGETETVAMTIEPLI